MKRTTVYWGLLVGILVAVCWVYIALNDYNRSLLQERHNNGLFRTIQAGDLYVLKDTNEVVQRFFKIVESTKEGIMSIAEGNLIL